LSDLKQTLLNLRLLRAHTRELDLESLEGSLEKLRTIVIERREEAEEERLIQEARSAKLEEFARRIVTEDIDVEALLDALERIEQGKTKRIRKKRPALYSYTTPDGHARSWTGQGRTPSVIQSAIDNGGSLEDFLIEKA
jgi:DNA-binding protein H-NS